LRMTGVGARNKDSAHCISSPVRKPTFARLKKSRILMQYRRKNRARHEVFDRPIRKRRSIPLGITLPTLPVTRFAILRLADARKNAIPRKLDLVERTSSHHFEFLLRGERRNFAGILQREEIRQRQKKSVIRRARIFPLVARTLPVLILIFVFVFVLVLARRRLRRSGSCRICCGRSLLRDARIGNTNSQYNSKQKLGNELYRQAFLPANGVQREQNPDMIILSAKLARSLDSGGFTFVYKRGPTNPFQPPKTIPLEMKPDLRRKRPRRHIVRAAKRRKKVIELVIIRQVDRSQLRADLIFVAME